MMFRYWVNSRYEGYAAVRVRPGQGLGGLVLKTGRPQRTDDWLHDERLSQETRHVVVAEGIVAQMVVPIRIGEQIEGLLYVDNRGPRPFTNLDEAALMQLAEHAAIAIGNAQLFAAVRATGSRLRTLSERVQNVQEAERRHIARELHDQIGPSLTALKLNLVMLQETPAAAGMRLADSLRITDDILTGVRRLSLDLRPALLDDLGLEAALKGYVIAQAERAGLAAQVRVDALAPPPPAAVATACFRIAQEAVTNVLRHAKARQLLVTLQAHADGIELIVKDDGVGFEVAAARRHAVQGSSLGLLGIEERAELVGGQATVTSGPGGGTEVRAWFPRDAAR
jgi:signal transduction histidine kinase